MLGETELGREFGLTRIESLADFRATVPLMDASTHAVRVTAKLGFGLDGIDDETLTAASLERAAVRGAWRQRLADGKPIRRVAVLWAPADDPVVDRMRLDDLRTLGDELELLRISSVPHDPEQLVAELRRFRPDALAVPSLATCAWLEGVVRGPLERRFTGLRWLLAEHDFDERIRSRLPVLHAGWLHPGGRIGVPARRGPAPGLLLATRSTILELLPHGDDTRHFWQPRYPDTINLVTQDLHRVKLDNVIGIKGSDTHLSGIVEHQQGR